MPFNGESYGPLNSGTEQTMTSQVPFLDLKAHHEPIMSELVEAFRRVTEASAFAGGPFVARFESEFAAFCAVRHAVGVGNGTDALWLSLLALGLGPGDEVLTTTHRYDPG